MLGVVAAERFDCGLGCCGLGEVVGERRGGDKARVDSGGEDW